MVTRAFAYNLSMIYTIQTLLGTAALERATLLINHLLGSEPAALQRLQPHVGRTIELRFDGWPAPLPALPAVAYRITPAALVEWCGNDLPGAADLRISIDASNPALGLLQAASGTRPRVEVAGDAAFASDVNWLFDNLRWDMQDDLARIVGEGPARTLVRLGRGVAGGMGELARTAGTLAARMQRGTAGQPPR